MRALAFLLPWLIIASTALGQAAPATKPGVTVFVYDLDTSIDHLPTLVPGQTPNISRDVPRADFRGPWVGDGDQLAEHFMGRVHGELIAPAAGTYGLRLVSSGSATLSVRDALVRHEPMSAGSVGVDVNLDAGPHPFEIFFAHDAGPFELRLEWIPPGTATPTPVPAAALRTADGLTHVVAPGPKRWFDPNAAWVLRPGDGRPLEGVHPSFTLEPIRPEGFEPGVGGLAFLPDGRLAVCTWDHVGAVYLLDGLDEEAGDVTITRFAAGLGEPLGLAVIDGDLLVAQKQEITRLLDTDDDGIADVYEAVAHGWPASYNYHEFTFNLVAKDGFLWTTTSVPLKSGDTMYLPGGDPAFPVPVGPGSLVRIDPKTRAWKIVADGFRTPNGLGIGPDGELFGSDNQGSWLPSSRFNHVRPGAFFGHQPAPDAPRAGVPPAVWLPQGEIGNSPAEPVLIDDGPYAGQMLVSDVTHGGIKRIALERVDGAFQGVVFRFSQGLEAGINRMIWGPDGALYVGGVGSDGNWNHAGTRFGLQRLVPNGTTAFEMRSVTARSNGLLIELTRPAPYDVLASPASYDVRQWRYEPTIRYGGTKLDQRDLQPAAALVDASRTRVFLDLPGLSAGHVVHVRLRGLLSDEGQAPWTTEAWYTLNALPTTPGPGFTPRPAPPTASVRLHEAEDAERNGPSESATNGGASGRGYLDYQGASGETITWSVPTAEAGTTRLGVRYANGGENRPLRVEVNDEIIAHTLDFPSTGGWDGWATIEFEAVLPRGQNTITLRSIGASGPNIDALVIADRSGADPPPGAQVLFDGSTTNAWTKRDGAPVDWRIEDGALLVSASGGDIITRDGHDDVQLHLEWLSPPGGDGQEAGNSGVKLQSRYEIQILNTSANTDPIGMRDAGAIYGVAPAAVNASRGAGRWQSYDVWFTAARWRGGEKITNARMTVLWNGTLVHDDVEIAAGTGQSAAERPDPAPILLQSHDSDADGPVRFRNAWVVRPPHDLAYPGELTVEADGRLQLTPTISGGAPSGYTVRPPLPSSLVLDGRTGVIAGIVTPGSPPRAFEVIAFNSAGSAITTVHLPE